MFIKSKSARQRSFMGFIFSLIMIAPVHAEHQEAYLCTYEDYKALITNEPEELVIGTALGVKGDLYYEELKWTKNGRKLIFSYPEKVNREGNFGPRIVKRDQQGREWLSIIKTDRGSGTMWLGTGKMVTQYRGPIIRCKVGLSTSLRLSAGRFMNDRH